MNKVDCTHDDITTQNHEKPMKNIHLKTIPKFFILDNN